MIRALARFVKGLALTHEYRNYRVLRGPAKGLWYWISAPSHLQRIFGFDELEIVPGVVEFAKRCKTFVDVGASDGFFSVLVASRNPACHVVACEPASWQRRIVFGNWKTNQIDESRLTYVGEFIGTAHVRLADVLAGHAGPFVIKIDVDGAEMDVLQSGGEALRAPDVALVVETHSVELEAACVRYLSDLGYATRIVKHGWWRWFIPDLRRADNRWLIATRPARDRDALAARDGVPAAAL